MLTKDGSRKGTFPPIHGIQLAANKVKNDTKTTQFRVLHSTKKPSFINWLDETAKTAKPLCVGSIPTRASIIPQQLRHLTKPLLLSRQ
jgi:hypothetical protein